MLRSPPPILRSHQIPSNPSSKIGRGRKNKLTYLDLFCKTYLIIIRASLFQDPSKCNPRMASTTCYSHRSHFALPFGFPSFERSCGISHSVPSSSAGANTYAVACASHSNIFCPQVLNCSRKGPLRATTETLPATLYSFKRRDQRRGTTGKWFAGL
jgi:hypothetical protein